MTVRRPVTGASPGLGHRVSLAVSARGIKTIHLSGKDKL